LFAGERMNISVCNLGAVPDKIVARAESAVAAVFSPLQIEVSWSTCEELRPGVRVLLRLRRDSPIDRAADDSAEILGMAFTAAGVAGNMADAYYAAIERFARRHLAESTEVLGYVVAHEIGHLLLGPGHCAGSIMAASWNDKTLDAVRQRWLSFNQSQRAAIHRELQARSLLAARR